MTTPCPRCRNGKETFTYLDGQYKYDVDRARTLAADGRAPVEVEEDSIRDAMRESAMDECHIDHVDPSIPGLIAFIEYRFDDGELVTAHVLIDGHHRAARCLRDGLPFFAYLLTEDESRAVLLRSPGNPATAG
jgi:hypothetical protein